MSVYHSNPKKKDMRFKFQNFNTNKANSLVKYPNIQIKLKEAIDMECV